MVLADFSKVFDTVCFKTVIRKMFHLGLLKSCYGTLRKRIHFKLRKRMVESLILSKLDYCDVIFYPLPQSLLKRLQRLQFAAASFVTWKYVNDTAVILKLCWLPMKERRDFSLLNLWPSYLNLQVVNNCRNLRYSAYRRLNVPLEKGTFQDSAAALFNTLPASITECNDFNEYCKLTKTFLKHRALDAN